MALVDAGQPLEIRRIAFGDARVVLAVQEDVSFVQRAVVRLCSGQHCRDLSHMRLVIAA